MSDVDISRELQIILKDDLETNLDEVIPYIKEKTENYIHNCNDGLNIEDLLDRKLFNKAYVVAQCRSVLDYIVFLYSDELRKINQDERLLMDLTRTFIFDFEWFNSFLMKMKLNIPAIYDPQKEKILTDIRMDRHVESQKAFVAAKCSMFNSRVSSPFAYEYNKGITPFVIRHAIELKIKYEMLGIDHVICKNSEGMLVQANIGISQYIDFLKNEGSNFFEFPPDVNIDNLQIVNRWSNNYIHTGLHQYVWQIRSALLAIEPLFRIEYGSETRVFGFHFRVKDFNAEKLKAELERKFSNKKRNFKFLMQS